jgi:cell division protein FtsL
MIVQSPLKKHDIRPNLRKVSLPDNKSSSPKNKRQAKHTGKASTKISLPKVKPWKVIVGSIIIGALGLLYLTHVFATQQLLDEVQTLEAEYNRARAQYDELKLRHDRMIGPAEIYRKAEEQGFVNGGPADKVIIIKE